MAVDFALFDADNHYYEAEDAFTRYIEPGMAKRCMQWADIDGRRRLLVGGRVNRFIPNPTFDPVARPGVLDDYFRARTSASDIREAFGELEPISPSYREPEARVALMDEQGLDAAFLFPTLGVGMESALERDLPAMVAAFTAFNRWLDDDWGMNHRDRLYAAPYLTLSDVDWACAELEWALDRGARVVNLRASSVLDPGEGRRALGHDDLDRFWARVAEAGITVAFHAGDSGYGFLNTHWGLSEEFEAFRYDPLRGLLTYSSVSDTVASLIAGGVFARHPRLRVATIENGSEWVGPLIKKLHKAFGQHRHAFAEDPVETFRRHVWVAPYYEDDMVELRALIGADHMLFGSDYPHAEGLADPASFVHDLDGFDEAEIRLVMHDNAAALAQPI